MYLLCRIILVIDHFEMLTHIYASESNNYNDDWCNKSNGFVAILMIVQNFIMIKL